MNVLYEAHSGWRYIVILAVILAILKLLIGWLSKNEWDAWDQRLGAALPIIMDIQLLTGLILFFAAPPRRMAAMRWEHLTVMLLTIIAAHVTWARVKKAEVASTKYRTGLVGYLIAGVLLAVGIMRVTGVM